MAAQAETMGFSQPFKDRRRGKDRRKCVDPRYRNPLYPAFVDRRKGERRKPDYDQKDLLIQEHPLRKWIVVIGLLAALFLTYLFFFTNFTVSKKSREERGRTQPITIGYDMGDQMARPLTPRASCLWLPGTQGAQKGLTRGRRLARVNDIKLKQVFF